MKRKMKNPLGAAFLNLILTGVGYIYNGKRKFLGFLLLIGSILGFFTDSSKFIDSLELKDTILMMVSYFFITFGLCYDAYREAKELNKINKSELVEGS